MDWKALPRWPFGTGSDKASQSSSLSDMAPTSGPYAGSPNEALLARMVRAAHSQPTVPLHVWTCDLDLRVTSVLYTTDSLPAGAYLGGTDYDWLSEEEAAAAMQLKRQCLAGRYSVEGRLHCTWQGKLRDFDLVVVPNFGPDGDLVGVTCVSVDITGELDLLLAEDTEVNGDGWRAAPPLVRLGDVTIDIHSHGLRGPRRSVRLTRTEWLLLDEMVRGRGSFLTHEELLKQVWGAGYEGQHRLLHDTISRLRHRLREAGGSADWIQTIHGIGYRLADES